MKCIIYTHYDTILYWTLTNNYINGKYNSYYPSYSASTNVSGNKAILALGTIISTKKKYVINWIND